MLPTPRTAGHLLYAKGCQEPGKGAWDIADAIRVGHHCWSLVLSTDEGTDAGDPLGEGRRDLTASLRHSCCAWGFSSSSIWVSLPQAPMGRSPFTRSVSKERPNISRWGSTHVLSPLLQLWLQQDRATLRSAGAQAMVLLPTTTACAASTRCRRCRARFCTNLG